MIKIHNVQEGTVLAALVSCRVCRVDSHNAVCMVHHPGCVWATPYGNYCEHPQVQLIQECEPGTGISPSSAVLH